MDQMVHDDIACNCIPIIRNAFCTHTFHFNCLFDDFNCVFTQIRCLSRVLVGGGVCMAEYLLPCCYIFYFIQFDMQHDNALKKVEF